MISADIKSNIKQQEIKDLVAGSYKLLVEVPSNTNFKYNIKGVYF